MFYYSLVSLAKNLIYILLLLLFFYFFLFFYFLSFHHHLLHDFHSFSRSLFPFLNYSFFFIGFIIARLHFFAVLFIFVYCSKVFFGNLPCHETKNLLEGGRVDFKNRCFAHRFGIYLFTSLKITRQKLHNQLLLCKDVVKLHNFYSVTHSLNLHKCLDSRLMITIDCNKFHSL